MKLEKTMPTYVKLQHLAFQKDVRLFVSFTVSVPEASECKDVSLNPADFAAYLSLNERLIAT